MNRSIIISGFGGQGVMLLGNLIGKTAFELGKSVTILPAYGNEQRGGTANCTVVFADDYVASPVAENPDILCALNQPSVDRFMSSIKPGGLMIINSSMATPCETRDDIRILSIEADKLATDLGSSKVANIIIAGAFIGYTGTLSLEILERTLLEKSASKPQYIELNKKALQMGYEIGCNHFKQEN
jgi:2-oxoglutarate ferredoxin oxidoreductase subunit gamma